MTKKQILREMHVRPRNLYVIKVPCEMPNEARTITRPVRTRHHKVWDAFVRKTVGGLTVLDPVKGQWVFGDKLFSERMIPVEIACTENQMQIIAEFTCQHYRQIEVMYYPISLDVRFVRYSPSN